MPTTVLAAGAGDGEAADIEGVVVVAVNAVRVADVFDQDAVVGSARRPLSPCRRCSGR